MGKETCPHYNRDLQACERGSFCPCYVALSGLKGAEAGRKLAAALKQRDGDQPLPVKNDSPYMQDLLVSDIEARKQVGIDRYGTALQAHNGRDVLRDAYEEAIDLALYLRQAIYERDEPVADAHGDGTVIVQGQPKRVNYDATTEAWEIRKALVPESAAVGVWELRDSTGELVRNGARVVNFLWPLYLNPPAGVGG